MRQYGFTLIEIVIVAAMVAVLATLAAPSMQNFIRASRLNSAANQFHADLLVARREAVRRNAMVLMCPKGTATATTCGTSASYANWGVNGWIVCYATDASLPQCATGAQLQPNDSNSVIRSHGATDSSITVATPVSGNCLNSVAVTQPIRFNADGSQGDQLVPASLSFRVTGTWTSAKQYCASIQSTGNIALTKPALPTM